MPRIAKSDVNAALALAAKSIVSAGGPDGRTSRAEMKAALKGMPSEQRALADIFFKFIDHRDFKAGAQVTAKDVNKAVAYAKQHMVLKYDLNQNGLSKDEISKMSLTGKNAVALAKALKAAGAIEPDTGGKLTSKQLGDLVASKAGDAWYTSESDYNPQYLSATMPAGHTLSPNNVMALFSTELGALFKDSDEKWPQDYTAAEFSARDGKDFVKDLRTDVSEGTDDATTKSAAAFDVILKALEKNMTGLKVYNVGPGSSGQLADSQGLYGKLIVGKTADGKIAGILLGSVET